MARRQQRGRIKGHARREVDSLAACECGWAAVQRLTNWGIPWTVPAANRARSAHLIDIRMAMEEITTKA